MVEELQVVTKHLLLGRSLLIYSDCNSSPVEVEPVSDLPPFPVRQETIRNLVSYSTPTSYILYHQLLEDRAPRLPRGEVALTNNPRTAKMGQKENDSPTAKARANKPVPCGQFVLGNTEVSIKDNNLDTCECKC